MNEEKKQQLFPYFAYLYSQQINPEKYGSINSIEEWTELIQQSPEDIELITEAASQLSDEDWNSLEEQYSQAYSDESAQYAKKGAKLKYLESLKKGGKKGGKKCACGCDLITTKEKGGKMTSKCSCGCKPKLENGGEIQKLRAGDQIKSAADYYRQKSSAESQRASVINLEDAWRNTKNTLSDFFNYGNLNYVPKTQYWYDSKMKSDNTLKPKTTVQTPAKSKVQIPAKIETKIEAKTTTPKIVEVSKPKVQVVTQPNTNISVVDYLNSVGRASDKTSRATLAKELGMDTYNFSAADNLKLLQLIKQKGRNTGNTGNMNIGRVGLGVPVNVPGMSIPVPKVQATPAVPGMTPRQGFPRNAEIMNTYDQMFGTPRWAKLNGLSKLQTGGDLVSTTSMTGVYKKGGNLNKAELKKEELKNAKLSNPKITEMQKSVNKPKDINKVMDKETLKRLKSKKK